MCTFSPKPRFPPIFSFFHVFAILRFRSISVPPTPPKEKINLFILGGGQKSSKCQETITPNHNTWSASALVINKAGFNRGAPRGPLSPFCAFSEIPRFRDFSTFRKISWKSNIFMEFHDFPIKCAFPRRTLRIINIPKEILMVFEGPNIAKS